MNWLYKLSFPSMNAPIPEISPQEADQKTIGPFYHGTSPDYVDQIIEKGFAWEENEVGSPGMSNGYSVTNYHGGCPAPVHHLGYGIYLTEVKSIAKQFGQGSMKNVLEFRILKNAKIEIINFGSTNTMMRWWVKNGYDCNLAKTDRVSATKILTENLKSKFDAVLFKGKGIRTLLDGNQICVYNPAVLVRVNKSLVQPGEIGSKVIRKQDGMKGVFMGRRPLTPEISQLYHNGEPEFLIIKWQKGGTDSNVYPSQVEFL